jgi:outer membrane protein insertion porin family
MPMTVNEVRVHGATNLRRGFLDPLIQPLVDGDPASLPSTVGEVTEKLRELNNKLNGLRRKLLGSCRVRSIETAS